MIVHRPETVAYHQQLRAAATKNPFHQKIHFEKFHKSLIFSPEILIPRIRYSSYSCSVTEKTGVMVLAPVMVDEEADMVVNKEADIVVDDMADMEVDKVADMVADMEVDHGGRQGGQHGG